MTSQNETQPRGQPPVPPASAAETQPRLPRPQPEPQPAPAIQVGGNVGGDAAGGNLNKVVTAGRDVVGRDLITANTTSTTIVGFSPLAVQRLVLSVGMMVFVTAACFFSGGAVVGGAAIAALATPPLPQGSAELEAARFAEGLQELRSLPPGTPFTFTFTESQISSYFRLVVAPDLPVEINEPRIRLLESGELVMGGRSPLTAGRPFALTFDWRDTPGQPLDLTGAAVQVLPTGKSFFGWVLVPTFLLSGLEAQLNALFADVQFTAVESAPGGETWTVAGIAQ